MSALRRILDQRLKSSVQRCCGGKLDRPSGPYSCVKSAINAMFSGHIKPNLSVWASHHKAAVVTLLLGRGPHAVCGAVTPVYVNALYRQVVSIAMGLGPLRKEMKLGPIRANSDPATAIFRPLGVVGTLTSSAHTLPNAVNAAFALPVRRGLFSKSLHGVAAARPRLAPSQVASNDAANRAASTFTAPKGRAAHGVSSPGRNAPKAKGLTNKVYKSGILCHNPSYTDAERFAMGHFA